MTGAAPTLAVAVVGHTNTGKTSLMRTLMRDVDFGEVSDRPAVTRAVEAARLSAGETAAIELYDTPGLEDSIGLLEHLDALRGGRRIDGVDVIAEFLAGGDADGRFAQEAKAIRQVLASDVALYVIDARDRVHGKHRDELEILGRCATPVVPVLNFVAAGDARTDEWREHLRRVNMHAVAEFDTVVFDAGDEQRLFDKMRTLLDDRGDVLETLAADRRRQRAALARSSAVLLADLLVDVAAYAVPVQAGRGARSSATVERLKQSVRDREQTCVEQLLALHRFRPDDVEAEGLPIEDGAWGLDLFSPVAMKQFGLSAGGAAATGAMIGLTADVMLGGLSLGTGAAAGAAIGGLLGAMHTHGRRLLDRARGLTELRCDDATLRLLLARQTSLVRALMRRGHASVEAVRLDDRAHDRADARTAGAAKPPESAKPSPQVARLLAQARIHPAWSSITEKPAPGGLADPARQEVAQELADAIAEAMAEGAGNAGG